MVNSTVNSLFNSKCYRVGGALLDPGDEWDGFRDVEAVLLTHAHFDHIYGLNDLLKRNPKAKVYTNEVGRTLLLDARKNMSFYHETPFVFNYPESVICVEDGDEITIRDNLTATAVFTPGHNPSCITWLINDCLFTGDAYIPGIKTVTNLPGGNKQQAAESIELIKKMAIGKTIYPGHQI